MVTIAVFGVALEDDPDGTSYHCHRRRSLPASPTWTDNCVVANRAFLKTTKFQIVSVLLSIFPTRHYSPFFGAAPSRPRPIFFSYRRPRPHRIRRPVPSVSRNADPNSFRHPTVVPSNPVLLLSPSVLVSKQKSGFSLPPFSPSSFSRLFDNAREARHLFFFHTLEVMGHSRASFCDGAFFHPLVLCICREGCRSLLFFFDEVLSIVIAGYRSGSFDV